MIQMSSIITITIYVTVIMILTPNKISNRIDYKYELFKTTLK